jgi:hypothetical protein
MDVGQAAQVSSFRAQAAGACQKQVGRPKLGARYAIGWRP